MGEFQQEFPLSGLGPASQVAEPPGDNSFLAQLAGFAEPIITDVSPGGVMRGTADDFVRETEHCLF